MSLIKDSSSPDEDETISAFNTFLQIYLRASRPDQQTVSQMICTDDSLSIVLDSLTTSTNIHLLAITLNLIANIGIPSPSSFPHKLVC